MASQDLAAAVSYISRNAATLGVCTNGYSLWGSSAGARMAGLGHGFGLGKGTSAEGWVWGAIRFWETSLGGPSTAPK